MNKHIDPYRILFPIGTLYAFIGVSLWLLFSWVPGTAYPGVNHARMMIGGFLISFVLGFLMTAIPKMTASFPAARWEISLAAVIATMAGASSLSAHSNLYYGLLSVTFVFLVYFGLRRVIRRTKAVPDFFVMVGAGILSGLLASVCLFLSTFNIVVFFDERVWRSVLYQGVHLFLVLGIGSRLVPMIAGFPPRDLPPGSVESARYRMILRVAAIGIFTSFIVEGRGWVQSGLVLRALISSFIILRSWKVFCWPQSASRLAYLMKASALMVLGGLWAAALQPALALHWMHLTYISGFGLMTLTVASRVTLAHGSYNLSFEAKTPSLWWVGGLVLFSAMTRVVAPHIAAGYMSHLTYAAILWLLSVTIWAWVFVRKIFGRGELDRPSC